MLFKTFDQTSIIGYLPLISTFTKEFKHNLWYLSYFNVSWEDLLIFTFWKVFLKIRQYKNQKYLFLLAEVSVIEAILILIVGAEKIYF